MRSIVRYWCLWVFAISGSIAASSHSAEWDRYGGIGGKQYTELEEITPGNLQHLELAWSFQTGDLNQGFSRKSHSFQTNPIYWNGALFISTSSNWVLAVNAQTGEEIWRFDPELPKEIAYAENASRGVSIWHGAAATCPDRILVGTLVGTLHALDARTGKPCTDFADNGVADMSIGVGEVRIGNYGITSPPAILGDQVIVGSAVGDNGSVTSERGIVRAIDVRSGRINWLWDPIPRSPGQDSYASWENDSGKITGAANAWPPLSVDEDLDLVYVPTGSPSPDFYGGERWGDNNYANSIVALSGSTGRVEWSQQLVHHDIWDYDIPSQPTLTQIRHGGEDIPAVVVVTKTGMLYAFDRRSGEPIYPIVEKPVPASDVPGERLSPTQPFSSVPPLVDHHTLGEDDAFGIAFFDKWACQRTLRSMRSEGIFTPISLRGSIMNPGYAGGSNWGGVAIDSERQIAIANVNQIPTQVRLIARDQLESLRRSGELDGWDLSEQEGTPYYMARRVFTSTLGLPCTKPPWGKLVAVDLAAGDILWEIALGSIRDLAPGIVPNFNWGIPNMGGPLITKSGLIIIGAAAEHVLRIYDLETGQELWKRNLPTAAIATPMSYEIDGEQYIAIAVGGYDNLDLPRGDYLMSFKLEK